MRSGIGAGFATWLLAIGCGRVGFDARGDGAGAGDGDGGATGDVSSDATQGTACTGNPVARSWPYTAGVEGWEFKANTGYTATMTWTASVGMPDAGALVINLTGGSGGSPMGWFYMLGLGDLTGRVASANVRTDAANVRIKVYGRNNSADWMDSGAVTLMPNVWSCVKLETANPIFMDPGFDTTMFDETGLHIEAAAPATIWVDHWGV